MGARSDSACRAPGRSRQSRLPGPVRPLEWQASHGAAIRCIPGEDVFPKLWVNPRTAQSGEGMGREPRSTMKYARDQDELEDLEGHATLGLAQRYREDVARPPSA